MDDPGQAWPYWKFGLKKDDLSKLHDQYNTFPSSIQDPEAFHHDVYELSHEAATADDFYRLMADRKSQRLRELNDSLESAALEIIANPSLIGTEQWQYALQLFRTKSLDSLVRYFASYLPENHHWHHSDSSSAGSISETSSSVDSVAHSHTSFFDDVDDKPLMTHEPLPLSASIPAELPLSPRSMTMRSDISDASPADLDAAHHKYILDNFTPARTLSFSGSESEAFGLQHSRDALRDEEASQPCDPQTPSTSISDLSDVDVDLDRHVVVVETSSVEIYHDEYITTQLPAEDPMVSETPTPKAEHPSAAYFVDAKPFLPHRRHRSTSPSRPHPLSQSQTLSSTSSPHTKSPPASPRLLRRNCSPCQGRRKAPGETVNRIQKPLSDPFRTRPRGRRRLDG